MRNDEHVPGMYTLSVIVRDASGVLLDTLTVDTHSLGITVPLRRSARSPWPRPASFHELDLSSPGAPFVGSDVTFELWTEGNPGRGYGGIASFFPSAAAVPVT